MDGADDPDNRRDFPGGFPGDKKDAFTSRGRTRDQQEIYEWVSRLMLFRGLHPALQAGEQQDMFVDDSVFAFVRAFDTRSGCGDNSGRDQDERFLILVNNAGHDRTLSLETHNTALEGCSLFTGALNAVGTAHLDGSKLLIPLAPKHLAIYSAR